MRYLIYYEKRDQDPFFTDWFQYEDHWEEGMIVFDLVGKKWTSNGLDFNIIGIDHL